MIQIISIKKLFGRFDYTIDLHSEGITILTGPNGFGKSTILNIISALTNGDLLFFMTLNYEEISINDKVKIAKTDSHLSFSNEIKNIKIELKDIINVFENYIESMPYRKISDKQYMDFIRDTIIDKKDVFNRFIEASRERSKESEERLSEDNASSLNDIILSLNSLKDIVGDTYFISEQRLIQHSITENEWRFSRYSDSEIIYTINTLPTKFKKLRNEKANEYLVISNSRDSTYPERLFSEKKGITELDFSTKMEAMKKKFKQLNEFHIFDLPEIGEVNFEKTHEIALKVYLEDFDEKYKVYEEFISKLKLYTDIINSKLHFKELKFSSEKGLVVVEIDGDKKEIPLSDLSSGEKHEIILFYDLIFESKPNMLLLIDEPEISLHVEWQRNFMKDMVEIAKTVTNLKIIVATHSPQIISNYRNLQIDLGELYRTQING
ncbi:hypothetical protein MmiAt1_11130 [Methanimicrococcus sp. At1]|uniref:Endonuclease GajA/Old nuclease/RecF-like AAA domain-containing protein n=1 Tax=Methanimicrococcus hacksteinii TaxID=3028293 RepID=A0ABU3VQ37_9EURY|nr:AAA family ATPase [Methanimicrococcus sp. At1]MDV0445530.1 hypothetical protein [Methanimicrococcus sp. At1]